MPTVARGSEGGGRGGARGEQDGTGAAMILVVLRLCFEVSGG